MGTIELKELEYFKLLTEKGVEVKSLPKEVQGKIAMLKANIGRYNQKADKTETFYNTIKKNDILIADSIITFLETGLPPEADFKAKVKTAEPVIIAPIVVEPVIVPVKSEAELAEEKRIADEKAEQDRITAEKAESAGKVTAIDNAIIEKINANSNKYISVSDLEVIAGKSLGGTEVIVGTLKLRKVFKASFYKIG